ncbi:MAG: hypothetical protein M1833_003692 [Piccolia ochrophora]|nr:MAG: hypothetical protein M1833_003692 [Piccolia ochrophora]
MAEISTPPIPLDEMTTDQRASPSALFNDAGHYTASYTAGSDTDDEPSPHAQLLEEITAAAAAVVTDTSDDTEWARNLQAIKRVKKIYETILAPHPLFGHVVSSAPSDAVVTTAPRPVPLDLNLYDTGLAATDTNGYVFTSPSGHLAVPAPSQAPPPFPLTPRSPRPPSVLAPSSSSHPKSFPPHPAEPRPDVYFEMGVEYLKQLIRDWAWTYFSPLPSPSPSPSPVSTPPLHPELTTYASSLTITPSPTWPTLLQTHPSRTHLIAAIVAKALQKHIFDTTPTHPLFGASRAQAAALAATQRLFAFRPTAGFARSALLAAAARQLLAAPHPPVPENFAPAVRALAVRVFALLRGLLPQDSTGDAEGNSKADPEKERQRQRQQDCLHDLWTIVDHAAKLGVDMAREERVFCFVGATPGARVDGRRMSVVGGGGGGGGGGRLGGDGDEGRLRVGIAVFPGVVALRRDGDGDGEGEGEGEGFRRRVIAKADVVVEWEGDGEGEEGDGERMQVDGGEGEREVQVGVDGEGKGGKKGCELM